MYQSTKTSHFILYLGKQSNWKAKIFDLVQKLLIGLKHMSECERKVA